VLAIAVTNFALLKLVPGDVADVIAGEAGSATPEYMADLRSRFGLDQSFMEQLWLYVTKLVQLDLGHSFRHNMPVGELILDRLGPTMLLMGAAILISVVLGVIFGVLSASKVNGWIDNVVSVVALVSFATPVFWSGLMAIVVFSVWLGWLPSGGFETIGANYTGWAKVADTGKHMVMPVGALSLFFLATYTRLMRASMLEVLGQDFITTARAKGLSERKVVFKHALRNALLPLVTMIGLQMGTLVGGSVLVETVFGWPGLGRLAFESVFQRDLNVLLGILFISSLVVLVTNILVDLVYVIVDPRIEGKGH
jgi:peptide/nickel transport system permease protein